MLVSGIRQETRADLADAGSTILSAIPEFVRVSARDSDRMGLNSAGFRELPWLGESQWSKES
jgi:hypothetical protein